MLPDRQHESDDLINRVNELAHRSTPIVIDGQEPDITRRKIKEW